MKNLRTVTLDELRRCLMPSELHTQLGWKKGERITARINELDKSLELRAKSDGELVLDELHRVILYKELCKAYGWNSHNKLTITSDKDNRLLKLFCM